MANNSKIEWTDATWNPITGCTPCSPGCEHCYARMMTRRLQAMGEKKYAAGFDCVVCHEDALMEPLHWTKPRRIFVCSMSDLFHEEVPIGFIADVFDVMASVPHHTFVLVTKRMQRMHDVITTGLNDYLKETFTVAYPALDEALQQAWPLPNVHLYATCCNQPELDHNAPILLDTPAAVRGVNIEPMLGAVNFRWTPYHHQATHETYRQYLERKGSVDEYESLKMLDGVIVGGESGPGARPMHPDLARGVRDQCVAAGVPFFFKQWGEWVPGCLNGSNPCHPCKECYVFQNCDIIDRNLSLSLKEAHERQWKLWDDNYRCISRRVGKACAGRMLDGREWNELPGKESK